ncbi:Six-hairpin glycosidase-like protein [Xylariomycetidae sp. FL2044]|nr:Six-hairpin glycosidase-like protein [Xylariomycetidae sp. FL2044]
MVKLYLDPISPITLLILRPLTALLGVFLPILAQDNTTSWHRYVRAPSSPIVSPRAVLADYTVGDVVDAEALLSSSGENATVLRRRPDSTENASLVLDFGQNVVGLLVIDFAGSVNGSEEGDAWPGLVLAFSETLEFLGVRGDFSRSDNAEGDPPKIVDGTDQVAVKNDPYTWTDQWGCEIGTQVCADGLHGFRYVKISLDALAEDAPYTSPYGEVAIQAVRLRWSGYLGTPDTYAGWFECSDPELTQLWYDGAYTTEMCTDVFRANDTEPRGALSDSLLGKLVIHDGAKRDRDPYMGDLAVGALTSYLTHDDVHEAARNVMEDLASHQRDDGWIPPASIRDYTLALFDYPLWWVSSSWDHVMYTGNLTYAERHYANLLSVLDTYYPAHTDPDTSLLIRQDDYGDYAFLPRPGSATYYSALYVLALNRAASLADLLSHPDDAARWRERASTVSDAVLSELWDPAAGAFLDRNCTAAAEAAGCRAHAQDGNSLAILAGIGDASHAASALAYLATNMSQPYGHAFYDAAGDELDPAQAFSQRVYPFISYFEAAARFEKAGGGDDDDVGAALDQIRRTWGWMAAHDPGATTWEGIGPAGSKYQGAFTSLAHAWSSGVTPLLTGYVLGVRPAAPGFREWVVKPRIGGGLEWAAGVVPTPYGPLGVRWEIEKGADGGRRVLISVNAPGGTNGTVALPVVGGEAEGMRIWADGVDGPGIVRDGFAEFGIRGGGEGGGGGEVVIGYPSTSTRVEEMLL